MFGHPDVSLGSPVELLAYVGLGVVAGLVARGTPPADDCFAAWLASRLAGFRRPRRWRWLPDLPRTALGKPRRLALATLIAVSP